MPVFEITAPDGKVYEVTGPEGSTAEQALARVKAQYAAPQPVQADNYSPTGTTAENFLAGAGKAFVDLGRGVTDVAGDAITAITGNRPEFAARNDAAVAESRRLDAPLMETGAGLAGNIAGNIAMAAPTMAIPGANTVAGAGLLGAVMGASEATLGDESRVGNAVTAGALGAGGQAVGGLLASRLGKSSGREAMRAAQNVERDKIVNEAMKAGYVLPPVSVNPQSKAAQVAESISGKVMTHQTAAVKNQQVTNTLAKQALGLDEAAPLTEDALSAIRKSAGEVYGRVGQSVDSFKADDVFRGDIDGAMADYRALVSEFPEMKNAALDGLDSMMRRDAYSGKNLLRLIRQLRKDAKTNYKNFSDPEKLDLARAQSRVAKALEDMAERNLAKSAPGLMDEFKAARATIAKSHAVESALDEAGNIDAHKIAKMLDKGEPLSGPLRTIGRVAQNFKDATRRRTDSVNPITLLTGATAAYGAGSDNEWLTALALARPGVRAAMLSRPGQSLLTTPQYGGRAAGLLGKGLESEYGGLLSRTLPVLVGPSQ